MLRLNTSLFRVFFVLSLCLMLAPQSVFAGSLGISPPRIEQEVLQGETIDVSVDISRSNPSKDEWVQVSIDNDPTGALSLREGQRILLPVGMEIVTIPFSINGKKLAQDSILNAKVRFTNSEPSVTGVGTQIILAVAVDLSISSVDELTDPTPYEEYSIEKYGNDVRFANLVFDSQTKEVHVDLVNNSNEALSKIPYTFEVSDSNDRMLGQSSGSTIDPITSGETQQVDSNILSDMNEGRFILRAMVGGQVLEERITTSYVNFFISFIIQSRAIIFSCLISLIVLLGFILYRRRGELQKQYSLSKLMQRTMFSKRGLFITLILVVVIGFFLGGVWIWKNVAFFTDLDSTSNTLTSTPFILISDIGGADFVLDLIHDQQQELAGRWNYIATSPMHIFAFPEDEVAKTEYTNRAFLFTGTSIQPFDLKRLPGPVSSVTENKFGVYALISGVRNDNQEPFYCLTEINVGLAPECQYVEAVIKEKINAISLSQTTKQQVLFSTEAGSFIFDGWTKKITPYEGVVENVSPLTMLQTLLRSSDKESLFGFVHLGQRFFFTPHPSVFIPLTDSIWVQSIERGEGIIDLYLVDIVKGTRSFLVAKTPSESIYWLENLGRITSPKMEDR